MNDIATTQGMPPAERPIETITQEIQYYKTQVGSGIIEIGRRLVEAKRVLSQGEWLPYLKDTVEFSERTAQNFMRIAKEYSDPQTVADLGAAKAVCLLALTQEEREDVLSDTHEVDGEEKTIYEMTKREVEKLTKEIAEERKKSETIQFEYEEKMNTLAEEKNAVLKALKKELEDLRNQEPQTIKAELDEASLERMKEEVKKSAAEAFAKKEAKLKEKINAVEKEVEAAKAAEAENLRKAEEAEAKAENMQKEMEKAEKEMKVAASPEITEFKVYFDTCRKNIEEMKALIDILQTREKMEDAEKLSKALNALCEQGKVDIEND